jgi:hypothetical protein
MGDCYDTNLKELDFIIEDVISDGGKNNFYQIPEWVNDVDDLCEYLELNFASGNILKSLWANKGKRHAATDSIREAKKRVHYANRELDRLEKNK